MRSTLRFGFLGVVAAIVVALLALLAVGCTDLSGTDTSAGGGATTVAPVTTVPPPTGVTTTPTVVPGTTIPGPPTTIPGPPPTASPGTTLGPPPSTPTTAPLSSAEELLPNGHIKAMGYIDRVWIDGGVRHLRIDYAEMLTGAEALAAFNAAKAAGREPADATLDSDWYISNVNPLKREFLIADPVAITTSTRWAPHLGMGVPCSWADFYNFWNLIGPPVEGDAQMPHVPWWIERDGNTVVKIDEQYLE